MDVASFWIGIAGLVISVLGFGLAVDQIRRVGDRAEAAAGAVKEERQRMAAIKLSNSATEMQTLEEGLLAGIRSRDTTGASRALREFRRVAVDTQSFAKAAGVKDLEMHSALELALGLVDLGIEDLSQRGEVGQTLISQISTACRLAQAQGNAIMLGESS